MNFNVLLPLPFAHGFDYRVPAGMAVETGDYVRVPFGRREVWGVVWGQAEGGVAESKIKAIEAVSAHLPPMSKALRDFIDWVSWYTLSTRGLVLKMALSQPDALEPPREEVRYLLRGEEQEARNEALKLTPTRLRILSYLQDGTPRTAKEIITQAKVSPAVLREFIKAGGVKQALEPFRSSPLAPGPSPLAPRASLSPAQSAACAEIAAKLARGFSVSVLDGVTGSGKTEVYFDSIARCLDAGGQALVLLPEIALSVQWLSRFRARFGFAPDIWHSNVTPAKKRRSWQGAATGEAKVVVGARSALFLPFRNLGILVVDEEHDASYKQEEGVIYQARDMAVARARHEGIAALLVSATPSLETEYNILHKRYARLHLPNRHGEAELPVIRLIDMRKEPPSGGRWISEPLRAALARTLAAGRQAMLFMNRRGYAPLMLCRNCGHRFQCPHCSAWLVLHKKKNTLLCHHCGHASPVPRACPDCRQENCLIPYGPGVERVAEEARALLPQARIGVMTSDASEVFRDSGVEGLCEEHPIPLTPENLITSMADGHIDLLIGTQMLAKGHHFAGLALVGVIDADMGLAGGDLRAGERTYQLLHQLAGRAGREKTKGEVYLQTYLPGHPVMQALIAGDRDCFMQLEASMREDALMPPYGKLAGIIVEGENERAVAEFARELVRSEERGMRKAATDVSSQLATRNSPLILGPAPAPLSLLRGKYRYRILVKAEKNFPLQSYLSGWLLTQKIPGHLRVKIDVDPYNFI